ncbi:thioredoxin domain-containing protein [Frankia sp. CNm7]|uniref:Thioredoxin domain-containing protein n=1 Tax=Frankia nepalensis TaxID=1836974 RepID=A0A937UP57_9ACTN|nr:thioredoxin domain-containing protein [Frankia nepalensis]MBL7498599.1 thioredoxin domain-containing protein [Frankia nepalensis]MBL7510468.1 thioredoxin domain-containing protein [Frankia nepalensis]MBL7517192.1 thioredoxin domain-containing protein [Frankia nepalensis]MBL7630524.1 thioredoxin domain-containing protein [Frankia nepalensis]
MANRLAGQTSPYLLQHADNPVDWWPWEPAAFAEAAHREVPVLLSVGYASCHWCHVMAHESFEDETTAAFMNEHFVNIKVDREERPDVDSVYMDVTVALTGHGGWPMTVFLTPTGEPFFAGTYFPPTPRPGMGSFRQVLAAVSGAWTSRREEIESSGAEIARKLAEAAEMPVGGGRGPAVRLSATLLDTAVEELAARFDPRHGGFGGAPKFPPSMVAELLLRHDARTRPVAAEPAESARGNERALDMVALTCERMARGGIYDQLAGGFARYSVDATWTVPHFEKMLYDNAQLLRVYLHLWRATGSPLAARVVRETAAFLLADLRTPQGGFASALDADAVPPDAAPSADGHPPLPVEGASYAWTPAQLAAVLEPDDAAWAARLLEVTAEGTFEHGSSVLTLRADPDDPRRYARVRAALLAARASRPQPGRDDKVVASWNGLAIAALAEAGAVFEEPAWVEAAAGAAALLRDVHLVDGRLRRTSRDGRVGPNVGVLDDYGNVADGLLALHQVTGDLEWLELAGTLLDVARAHFRAGDGGFHDTADDAPALLRRPRESSDSATPSGQAALAGALLTYAALTGSTEHREDAEATISLLAPLLARDARFAGHAGAVAEALLAGPAEVAVVGRPDLERLARLGTAPGAVVVTAGPLTADRPEPGVYVCRHFVCERPARTEDEVRRLLGVRLPG